MKKKRIIIMSIISLILVLSIATVYAAYTYVRKIKVTNEVGVINVSSQCFYDYSKSTSLTEDNENYYKALKLRNDTVAVIDNITFNTTEEYVLTGDATFVAGKEYYIKTDGVYSKAQVMIDATVPANTYYEHIVYYNSIKAATAYDQSLNEVAVAINNNTNINLVSLGVTIACVIGNDRLDSITINTTNDYRAVLNTDGKGFVILDNELTVDSSKYTEISSSRVKVSATEKKYLKDVSQGDNKIYLSQLGLHFEFKADIAVYVRVRIKQQWNKIRIIGATERKTVGVNELANGQSPFLPSGSEWFAQELWNKDTKEVFSYIYLKNIFTPENPEDIQSYTLNVYEAYYKEIENQNLGAAQEFEDVVVSFDVDIVQANRAKALWGVDPSTFTN